MNFTNMNHTSKWLLVSLISVITSIFVVCLVALVPLEKKSQSFKINGGTNFGEEQLIDGNYEYALNEENKAIILRYNGTEENVDVPLKLDNHLVVEIGEMAFAGNETIKSVTLPGEILYIRRSAFGECINLESVTMPEGLIEIGEYAFYSCYNLVLDTIPRTVKSIGDSAFMRCNSIETITMQDNVEYLGKSAFEQCSKLKSITLSNSIEVLQEKVFSNCEELENVNFPENLKTIKDDAFTLCPKLTSIMIPKNVETITDMALDNSYFEQINVSDENEYFSSVDGVLFSKDKTTLIKYPNYKKDENGNNITTYTIPENVTIIEGLAFSECKNLEDIKFPSTLKEIRYRAFSDCTGIVSKINIPEGVTEVGEQAFVGCKNIPAVILPTTIAEIKSSTLSIENLEYVIIPKGVTTIDNGALSSSFDGTVLCAPGSAAELYAATKGYEINLDAVNPIISASIIGGEIGVFIPEEEGVYENDLRCVSSDSNLKFLYLYKNGELVEIAEAYPGAPDYMADVRTSGEGNYKIVAIDLVGNETVINFEIRENVDVEAPQIISITYNDMEKDDQEFEITNQNVKVEITLDEVVKPINGWDLSEDGKVLTKIFEENTDGELEVEIEDKAGNTVTAIVEVDNIDKSIEAMYYLTKEADKTHYIEGEDFDPEGLEITAIYIDGTSEIITGYKIVNGTDIKLDQDTVTIKIGNKGRVLQPITVEEKILEGIEIIQEPYKTIYAKYTEFSRYGMIVVAYFNNGKENVTDYEVLDAVSLTEDQTSLVVRYTFRGEEATAEQPITVRERLIDKLEIITEPDIVVYKSQDAFNPEGMTVQVTYTDGETEILTDYRILNGSKLQLGQEYVTIMYSEGGVTLTAKQDIVVTGPSIANDDSIRLHKIAITKRVEKTIYFEGENFDSTGLELTATYTDGSRKVVTDFKVSDGDNLMYGKDYVIISYTEGKITKTIKQYIVVYPAPEKIEEEEEENQEDNNEEDDETPEEIIDDQNKPEEIKELEEITGYKVVSCVLTNVKDGTPIEVLKEKLSDNGKYNIIVLKENEEVTTGIVTTGMIVKIQDENGKELEFENGDLSVYEIAVLGDVNGDGYANAHDSLMIKAYRNEVILLSDSEFRAADINGDGRVNFKDTKLLLYHRAEVEGYNLNYNNEPVTEETDEI